MKVGDGPESAKLLVCRTPEKSSPPRTTVYCFDMYAWEVEGGVRSDVLVRFEDNIDRQIGEHHSEKRMARLLLFFSVIGCYSPGALL